MLLKVSRPKGSRATLYNPVMKARCVAAVVLAFAAMFANAQVEQIAAAYRRQSSAVQAGDLRALFSTFAPDAYVIDLKGRKMPITELRDWWTPHLKAKDASFTVKSIRLLSSTRDSATVRITRELRFTGRVNVATFEDTWLKTKTGWLLAHGQAVRS